jgi:uncharacterized tellurite resistance protein B-like protein
MTLLDQLREFLGKRDPLATDKSGRPADVEIEAATAILLLEAAYGDSEYEWSEHRTLLKSLEDAFGLDKKETLNLLDRAEEIRPPIVKLADVTDVLVDRFSEEQRAEVVSMIWKVVEADDVLEEWEESFANHIAKAVGLDAAQAKAARDRARAD